MKTICLDFETYFDDEYSIRNNKLTTEEYVRDPRFEAHGCAIFDPLTNGAGQSYWLLPKQMKELCEAWRSQQRNGIKIALLAHHAHFDGLILNEHFGFRPDFWLDTLSMGRVVFDSSVRLGLEDIAERLGLQPKTIPYDRFKGKHWSELDVGTQNDVANGAMHDCTLTWDAANIMLRGRHPAVPYAFPASQLPVIDIAVRMFTEPTLVGDLDLLGEAWTAEQNATKDLFDRIGLVGSLDDCRKQLRKDAEFARMLEELGVEPELKTTAKGNEKFAFAKSDYFMQDLLYGENEDAALLVEARLKAQSSIYRTRIERYGYMATRGAMCVYLAFAAAHTRRFGGGDKTNFQNLPRPDEYKPQKGALRRAIKAP